MCISVYLHVYLCFTWVQGMWGPEGDNGFPLELELLVAQEYPVSTLNTELLFSEHIIHLYTHHLETCVCNQYFMKAENINKYHKTFN